MIGCSDWLPFIIFLTTKAHISNMGFLFIRQCYLKDFTSTELHRKRVIQLGESPETVFNVGAIGLDSIKNLKLLSKKEFEKSLNFKLGKLNFLLTFFKCKLYLIFNSYFV